ncbi:MAG: response regulator [Bryobacterales bacterium]|nr:response regulator [Bryobacterales bacterium]
MRHLASELGRNTLIEIEPAAKRRSRRSDPSIPPCVLIVDDDSMSRELMKEALEPLEYRLLEASDGLEALDILEKDKVDVMLVDVQMPHLDGFGFLSRVRQMDAFANIPIVAVTAYAVGIDRSRLSGHDFDQYLSKPVPVSTLRQVVRTMLESSGSDSRN